MTAERKVPGTDSCASSAATSAEFSLRDLQEAVAIAATGDWQTLTDAVPQEVWDDLHERGLVSTHRDITGEGETGATAAGIAYLADRIKGTQRSDAATSTHHDERSKA